MRRWGLYMNKSTALMLRATTCHKEGRFDEAEKLYCDVIGIAPKNVDAHRLLGALYLQTKRAEQAVASLKRALQYDPNRVDVLNNLGTALAFSGQIQEAVPYFRNAVKVQPDYIEGINNLANSLRDTGKRDEAATCYADILRRDPKHLNALSHLGDILRGAGKLDEAIHYYQKAAALIPDNFRLFNNLGNLLREAGRPAEAIASYETALKLNANCVEAYINMGAAQRDLDKTEDAKASYETALKLKPDSAEAHINYGALHQDSNDKAAAEQHYQEALRLNPNSVDAQWNRALIELARGNYREGWKLHEVGLGHNEKRGPSPFQNRRWQGEPLEGKRLLIWSEQGLGDSLQFIRYAEDVKKQGAHVMVLCPASLSGILATNPYVDEVRLVAHDADFDFHIPMMSLPFMFNTAVETIPAKTPYLFVTPEYRKKWATRLANHDGFKVGLVWAGNPRKGKINLTQVDKRRSMELRQMLPLLDIAANEIPSLQFFSLQMDEAAKQIEELGLHSRIINPMPDVQDFMDTAAIMEKLDLLISVDTSVVHLAGAMGKPVWVLSRHDACWRWLENREASPWYPSARVFGQPQMNDWDSVIAKVRQALAEKVSGQH